MSQNHYFAALICGICSSRVARPLIFLLIIATDGSESFMITDADKQDETMELGRNLDRGNS